MKKLLVTRFSAMGDVALCSPVVSSILEQHEDVEIVFLSRGFFKAFFQDHPRFTFVEADLKGKNKGVPGLHRLKRELLKEHQFDGVIDLHDVLRTKILRADFKLSGVKSYSIDKGRSEKKKLISGEVEFTKLRHTTTRYFDVFAKAGFESKLTSPPYLGTKPSEDLNQFISELNGSQLIGIAPFAAHPSKEWGLDKIKSLIEELSAPDRKILLFGGGAKEVEQLNQLNSEFPQCTSVAGKFNLTDELALMQQLNLMVAMDSSNMHLATLVGTPVVSIWGPTHHYLGFGPLNNEHLIVEVDQEELPCRPCTVYGKLNSEEDIQCAKESMERISVQMVLDKINSVLS